MRRRKYPLILPQRHLPGLTRQSSPVPTLPRVPGRGREGDGPAAQAGVTSEDRSTSSGRARSRAIAHVERQTKENKRRSRARAAGRGANLIINQSVFILNCNRSKPTRDILSYTNSRLRIVVDCKVLRRFTWPLACPPHRRGSFWGKGGEPQCPVIAA